MATQRAKKSDPLEQILQETEEQASPNDSAVLNEAANKASVELEKGLKVQQANLRELQTTKKIAVSMSPMYRDYFGDIMTVSLNGLSIYFPVDGRTYTVPEPYACIIKRRQRAVDDQIKRNARMANVTQNKEVAAGAMDLIPR